MIDPKVVGQVGLLLASLGVALQWLRAIKGFPEWGYYALVLLVTVGGVWLSLDGPITDLRAFILVNWPIAGTLFTATMGGTQAVSSGARKAVENGADPTHAMIPLTNSK